jgi:LAO/AO transport system kinase
MIADQPLLLLEKLRAGDRRALAKAITLMESARPDHQEAAQDLLAAALPLLSGVAWRIAISGVPGVGKSTFIEAFGLLCLSKGRRVAVLAIDPSSQTGGGAILGDKTRMENLAREANAFIRPSPSGGSLGGIARRTAQSAILAEVAGYDVVIIETVGVGQSETAAASLCDLFLLLLPPAGGDELQGIKRGIVELADMVVVNKADGDLLPAARHAEAEYRHALSLLRPVQGAARPTVLSCSALTHAGMDQVWAAIAAYFASGAADGGLERRRQRRRLNWMRHEIRETLMERFTAHPSVRASLPALEEAVLAGRMPVGMAVERLLHCYEAPALAADGAAIKMHESAERMRR